jgi:hypothetical protein
MVCVAFAMVHPASPIVGCYSHKQHAERQEASESHGQYRGSIIEVVAQSNPIDWDVEKARQDEGQSNPFMDFHDARKSDVTE